MYEKYINEITDLVLLHSDDSLYLEERITEILKMIYQKHGDKSLHLLSNMIVEYLYNENYSKETIYKVLEVIDK